MSIELVKIKVGGKDSYAAVDLHTGELNVPFTQFMAWLLLGKSVRKSKTRGVRPTSNTLREYAYKLKRWFDFISDWNDVADDEDCISWRTAQKKHREFFLDSLTDISPSSRNGLRIVWDIFYEDFCEYMDYSHSMRGLSEYQIVSANHEAYSSGHMLKGTRGKKHVARVATTRETTTEKMTYRVLSLDHIALLIKGFGDAVYSHITYFMFVSGLRLGGALQVYYPHTDEYNPYITSPELLRRDYEIEEFFTFKYVYKGHEVIGDLYECDIPVYAWEDIWEHYRPLQVERLDLWREKKVSETGDSGYKKKFPKSFWLTEDGREVKPDDVWAAFRETCKKIQEKHKGFPRITTQMLRHSYATWLVVCYADAQKVALDPDDKSCLDTIHGYAQEQLGHKSRETTKKYMRTAQRVVMKRWLPKVMPRKLPDGRIISGMSKEQALEFKRHVDFDGFMKSLTKELQCRKDG